MLHCSRERTEVTRSSRRKPAVEKKLQCWQQSASSQWQVYCGSHGFGNYYLHCSMHYRIIYFLLSSNILNVTSRTWISNKTRLSCYLLTGHTMIVLYCTGIKLSYFIVELLCLLNDIRVKVNWPFLLNKYHTYSKKIKPNLHFHLTLVINHNSNFTSPTLTYFNFFAYSIFPLYTTCSAADRDTSI